MSVMDYIEIVMMILGGLGAFLMGMTSLSDNMSRLAHGRLQQMLNKTAKSRLAGVGIGTAVTMIAQSSSLTTVMVVGLVNAGVMTLFQATAVIMGANIGTTITAQIVALNSFDVATFALSLTAIGVFVAMFSKKEKVKSIGSALAGLGLIFVGLDFMSSAMDFDPGTPAYNAITSVLSSVNNPVLLLLIGIVVTAIVQSSSAVTAIIITMASTGLIIGGGGNAVYYVVIGSNIGTCVTALLSSIGASANAKRAATIHFMFNFFGAIIFTIFLLCWPSFAEMVLVKLFPGHPETQIAMFHTFFNVVCTILFLPFVNLFVKLSNYIVRDKKTKAAPTEAGTLTAEMDQRLLRSPSVALGYLYQETGKVFTFAMNTLTESFDAFLAKDVSVKQKVTENNEELAQVNLACVLAVAALVLLVERLPKHLAANEGEQDKGNPVVNGLDEPHELTAKRPANERHEPLKPAEEKCQHSSRAHVEALHPKSATDGNRKRIHGKPHGNQQQLDNPHTVPSRTPASHPKKKTRDKDPHPRRESR